MKKKYILDEGLAFFAYKKCRYHEMTLNKFALFILRAYIHEDAREHIRERKANSRAELFKLKTRALVDDSKYQTGKLLDIGKRFKEKEKIKSSEKNSSCVRKWLVLANRSTGGKVYEKM